jgi:hypothetical protein
MRSFDNFDEHSATGSEGRMTAEILMTERSKLIAPCGFDHFKESPL